jgi:hypothetical protein
MQDYRAFVVGPDGHVLQRHEFWCANDEETKSAPGNLWTAKT